MNLKQQADFIRNVCIFLLTNRGRCFSGWPASKVFKYVAFHALAGTLFVVEDNGIKAVAIAWLDYADEIKRRERRSEFHFNWALPPGGDAVLVADVVSDKQYLGSLLEKMSKTWPDVAEVFTFRNQRLHCIPRVTWERLFR
jgi:hypothetical protein